MSAPTLLRTPLRTAAVALAATVALASPFAAFAFQPSSATPDERNLDNHNAYLNRDGQSVHAPAHSLSGRAPDGATARCRDGTYSFSRHRSGTCSRHGGVAEWL
ncbi:DUF3761 domain-containing protein [Paraburkholderia caballeronis]|uniref:DUF3761 domain-containing protein n=1 Tax=Paraburkholderia caballeronis TaxID=416943 RepID=A0A1H7VCL8_9BURK|nr:DUF3761 domain-containing protein [Paraburkholderia caballeronis]PXW16898.1 uncharacterized protein DUF3761 [Paraburkholderia caballeronis]PXW94654.1 uncharacterized protein DUF3761 [Paraburkholderia caballeronis]RAJ89955.1 uncharacterized protein DUF3761 [Paraburkholderia caballeronis]SEB59823.1 Protein of unknown function [Paraburkholderia caballeronis]SEM06996.1 Protein of unknown function [Paraburkholderia caballeronis]